MRIKELYLVLTTALVWILISALTSFSVRDGFIIGFQAYLLLRFINNIGYTICYFDFLCFYSIMDTLLMPLIGYNYFDANNHMARTWGWYMRVPADTYFSFLIPANLALFAGVNLLTRNFKTAQYRDLLAKLSLYAKDKGKPGIVLTIIGFISTFFIGTQSPISFVIYLLSMLKYVGPFYIYFSDSPFRKNAFFISIVVFLAQSIIQGLFGEFVMYLILALIVMAINFRLKFFNKLVIFLIGLAFVFILQSIKGTYRQITWAGHERYGLSSKQSSSMEIFGTLFMQRLKEPSTMFDERTLFLVYTRINQGYLISRAMNYVPRVEPYANGETLIRSLEGIIVPRFLWPDKPEAGGHENLARFMGIKQRLNYSMNIGPYGEAYGNFGTVYGVVFIFFYAICLSWLFKILLVKSSTTPTLLIWAPLLFFYALTVETDIFSTINFIIKAAIFIAVLYWGAQRFFKVSL